MALGRVSVGLGAFLIVAACGGSSDSITVVVPTAQDLQALGTTYCAQAQKCVGDTIIKVEWGSQDGCVARFVAQLELDIKSTGYGVTSDTAKACNTALAAAACADVLNGNVPAACQFVGTLADGSTCTNDAECTSGACFVDDAATCGKCGARAALGADCTNASCARGLKCSASKTCMNPALGAACTEDADCATDTYCRNSVCTAPLASGAACVVNPSSADVPCDFLKATVGCVPAKITDTMSTCQTVPSSFAENGGQCGLVVTNGAAAAIFCDDSDCTSSKCVARLADGASCTATGTPCQSPATCRNGICALKDPTVCIGK